MADFLGIQDDEDYQAGLAHDGSRAIAGINSILGAPDIDIVTPPSGTFTDGWLGWEPGVGSPWSALFRRFRYRPTRVEDANLLTADWFGTNPIPPLSGNPAQLSWAPLPQVNPTFVKVNPDGTLNPQRTFGESEDVYIVGPLNVPVEGNRTVTVRGGRRVRFIGGEYINALDGAPGTVLRFLDQTQQVFVEGVLLDKQGSIGDGLVWSLRPACDLIIQNCHITGIAGDAGTHGDGLQIQGPMRHLMIDKLTGDTTFQGLFLPGRAQQDGVAWGIGKGYLRRVNLKLTHENFTNNWHLIYLRDSCVGVNTIKWPVTLEQVWLDPLTKAFNLAFRPNSDTGACGAAIDQDPVLLVDRAIWPAGEGITGQANKGLPASGDFVPRSNAGRSYSSPGYLNHPYVTGDITPPPPDLPEEPPPPPEEPDPLILGYVKPGLASPVAGVDDVYGPAYNFARFRELYRDAGVGNWDTNLDGHLDPNFATSSGFNNIVNTINSQGYTHVALDWEVKVSPHTGSTDRWEDDATGRNGTTRQTAALNDGITLVNELKSRCPNAKFGWYFLPKQFGESSLDTPVNATLADAPNSMAALWQVVDFISPDIYQRFKIVASAPGSNEIDDATDLERMTNFADLCLACAEAGGPNVEVFPHVSNYYLSNTANPLNNTAIPLEEMYNHIKRFMQTTRNGKRPRGVMWWHGGSSFFTNITEAQVKAMYQAVNLLPYAP